MASHKAADDPQSLTAYTTSSEIKAFDQPQPGSDKHMDPLAQHTKVEKWDDDGHPYLEEYVGSGKLKGKRVIVTGGDSGIGRSVAICAAREGARSVTISYLPAEEHDAEHVVEQVESAGSKGFMIPLDLLDGPRAVERFFSTYAKNLGEERIDVLVNNASTQIQCKDLSQIEMGNVETTLKVNVQGMINVTKEAIKWMIRGGSIVNSSSVTAFKGSGGMVDYSATKGAILAFTRSMALQLQPKGIRVNVVAPGPVYTPLQPASRAPEQMEGWGLGEIPLRKRVAQPAELAPSYIFLMANGDSNTVSGCTLMNCGGQYFY